MLYQKAQVGLTAAVARPDLELLNSGPVAGEVPGFGVTTGIGVCAVRAPVLGSCATPDAPPSRAGVNVCPGATVWPGCNAYSHNDSHHSILGESSAEGVCSI